MSLLASVQVRSRDARYAQDIHAGQHALVADEPPSLGGADAGPAPYALLLSALGACTSITLSMYAERKGWDVGAIAVDLRHFKEDDAERIERNLRFEKPLTDVQRQRLAEIAETTQVTKKLRRGVAIATVVDARG